MVCRALVLALVGLAGSVTLGSTEGHAETEVQIRFFRPTQHIGRGTGAAQKPKVKALANIKRRNKTKVRPLRKRAR